jgi:hypothetical protein
VGTCHAMGGHRSLLMGMVWEWVQIRRKMLGSDENQGPSELSAIALGSCAKGTSSSHYPILFVSHIFGDSEHISILTSNAEYHRAGYSAQSELFFRLLLKNTVRWVHIPAYPTFWIAPSRGPPSITRKTESYREFASAARCLEISVGM